MPETPLRVCFDTNVVLDVLLDRAPFTHASAQCVEAVVQRQIHGLLCATTLTTIDYVLGRLRDSTTARQGVVWLLEVFDVAAVDRLVLDGALALNWSDFEDAVLHEAARLSRADAIVTRNAADFTAATLSIYTPENLLALR